MFEQLETEIPWRQEEITMFGTQLFLYFILITEIIFGIKITRVGPEPTASRLVI